MRTPFITLAAALASALGSVSDAATSAATAAAGPATASATDPLQSAPCRAALQALQAGEQALLADPLATRRAAAAQASLAALRQAAARACLNGTADAMDAAAPDPAAAATAPAARTARPPLALTPAVRALRGRAAPPSPAGSAAPPRPAPLRTLSACDATGCWTSDGTRLPKVGSQLLGPTGFCTAAGGILQCP